MLERPSVRSVETRLKAHFICEWSGKTAFKIIDISSAKECCATQCNFNNIMFFKTTDQMMLDIGGVYSHLEVYHAASTYSTITKVKPIVFINLNFLQAILLIVC